MQVDDLKTINVSLEPTVVKGAGFQEVVPNVFVKTEDLPKTIVGVAQEGKKIEDILNENEIISDIDSKLEYFIHKYNITFPKKKISEMETKDKLKFISKIIESQYGLSIIKDSGKNYYLSDNKKWDELYEYRNNTSASGKKLNDKIVKKQKENINIDQSWFEE